MRYGLMVVVLLGTIWVTHAQNAVACVDGQTLENGVTLVAPSASANDIPRLVNVSVIGMGAFVPVMSVGEVNGQSVCVSANPAVGFLSANLPDLVVPPSPNTVVATPLDPTQNRVTIGSATADGGQFLVIVEGATASPKGDVYTLTLSPAMRESGVGLDIFAVAVDDTSDPLVTLLDADNQPLNDADGNALTCNDAGTDTCYGESVSLVDSQVTTVGTYLTGTTRDAALKLDLAQVSGEQVTFRVEGGAYTLLLHMANGAVVKAPENIATLTQASDTGMYALACDGISVWTKGIPVTLPPLAEGAHYTITALGVGNYDPVLAVVNPDGSGTCADNSSSAETYAVNVPSILVPNQTASAQVTVTASDQRVFVGARDSLAGDVFVFIEGLSMQAGAQSVIVETTSGMVEASNYLTVYAIALTGDLDPKLSWVTPDGTVNNDIQGLPVSCDNAGIPETCYGQNESLRGSSLNLAEGRALPMDSVDAQLNVPVYPDMGGQPIIIQAEKVGESGAEFVMVLHIFSN